MKDDQSSFKTHEVVVAGLPLRLRSSHDEITVQALVNMVDERVKDALSGHSNISFQNAIVLAALHMAEDLVFLKRGVNQRLDQLEAKAKSALSELNGSPLKQLTLDQ